MTNNTEIRLAKLERLRSGQVPRALELCSGAGGLSLGMAAAGVSLVAHVEMDETAAASYALNFRPPSRDHAEAWAKARSMVDTDPALLVREIGLTDAADKAFDILAAGLPCQAFARIGRSKLRSITGDDDAYKNDARAKLYERFLQYVNLVQPVAILLENVPDILNFGGHNVPEEICRTLDELGYVARYSLLNAAFYGVPQLRERLFLVAIDKSLGHAPSFPKATRAAKLPSGYLGARAAALGKVPKDNGHYVPSPEPRKGLQGAVSVKAALADLPAITEHFTDAAVMRRRKLTDQLPYSAFHGLSDYATRMRTWAVVPKTHAGTDGHLVRITPRDFPIFHRMKPGDDYPKACEVAEAIFAERLAGCDPPPDVDSDEYARLRATCVPPYDPGKFPNKWWKLDARLPSRTLTAHMGKDTYSHIHWDSAQKRTISVREAARLQSFPDGFKFAGAMNAAFKQIGNAVPPLLAEAVATSLKKDLLRKPAAKPDEHAAADGSARRAA